MGLCIAAVSMGGCGTNEATEAASESAQTEGEGTENFPRTARRQRMRK